MVEREAAKGAEAVGPGVAAAARLLLVPTANSEWVFAMAPQIRASATWEAAPAHQVSRCSVRFQKPQSHVSILTRTLIQHAGGETRDRCHPEPEQTGARASSACVGTQPGRALRVLGCGKTEGDL